MIYFFSVILFFSFNFLYIKIWKAISKNIPTGIGICFLLPLIYFGLEFDLKLFYLIILILFSLIYFIDDLVGLNFLWRVLIQILTSIVLYFLFFIEINFIQLGLITLIFFISINTLNFQDGEDLNIATLLIIIFLVFYFFSSIPIIKNISELILLYLLIFGILNKKKKNLYFGDVGCFISTILIFLFIIKDIKNLLMMKVVLSVILFPILETFIVNLYRIYKRENLLTRNYYYIYQIIAKKTKYKLYLFPNIFFSFLNYLISSQSNLSVQLICLLIFLNLALNVILRFVVIKFPNYNEN
jgi:UDP-N-acetylmuramyl pentapeptide phosphotransferase/UDP-N-acetylglucosamine-1-phosphate transferase